MAKDVCLTLGFTPDKFTGSFSWRLKHLSKDERRALRKSEAPQGSLSLFSANTASILMVSESGLYKLVMRSDKPEAKRFQDWVTREVLPSIRKTGTYTHPEARRSSPNMQPSAPKAVGAPHRPGKVSGLGLPPR